MYVNNGSSGAILQTNRLEIDTAGTTPTLTPPTGPNAIGEVYTNLPGNPWNVLGEPDAWIEIRYAGNTYAVPGYLF